MTLDQDNLRSTTTSRADPTFAKDRLWLNGKEEEIKEGGRLATCISEMKRMRKEVEEKSLDAPKVSLLMSTHRKYLHIVLVINIPCAYLLP